MQKIIGVTELQRRFRVVFDEVARKRIPYVLTRGSRPEAALIPYDEFLELQALKEQDVLACFDRLTARLAEQNAGEEEVAADVAAALDEVRDSRSRRRMAN
jgi:prevent-host-death family protein